MTSTTTITVVLTGAINARASAGDPLAHPTSQEVGLE
jgi:hypothetical protein